MGLAILPPRLVPELGAVREHLLAAKSMPATTLPVRSRAMIFAAATPHG